MVNFNNQLRIALIAGSLGLGGAEKQLVYMARTLKEIGIDVRVYSLTHGEFYETTLKQLEIPVIWVGRNALVPVRLVELIINIFAFRPHFVQACHFYVNLYAVITARLVGAIDIGSVRSNLNHSFQENGFWGKVLLIAPRWILTNSYNAKKEISFERTHNVITLPNIIDVGEFDLSSNTVSKEIFSNRGRVRVVFVGRLIHVKRVDRLLRALALIRHSSPAIQSFIVGDGPEREYLEGLAHELGLSDEILCFLGRRNDIPSILLQCDIFVLTSNHEGFPNVLLEAMAASLPVITTPAGDSALVVQDGITGYVVDFDDLEGMAERILYLSRNPGVREKLGGAGRKRIETSYNMDNLGEQLLAIYRRIFKQTKTTRETTKLIP